MELSHRQEPPGQGQPGERPSPALSPALPGPVPPLPATASANSLCRSGGWPCPLGYAAFSCPRDRPGCWFHQRGGSPCPWWAPGCPLPTVCPSGVSHMSRWRISAFLSWQRAGGAVLPRDLRPCREGLGSSEGLRDPQLSPGPRAQAAPEAAGESQPGWHCRAPGRTGPAPAQPAKLLPPLLAVSPGPRGCSKPPAGHTAAGGEGWPCSPAAWQ